MIKRTLFFGNKSSLTTRNEQLIIKTNEKEASIPIEDIGFVVIENQESYISLPTINKLINNNVAVIFCNEKHMPSSMLMNLDGHHLQHEFLKHRLMLPNP